MMMTGDSTLETICDNHDNLNGLPVDADDTETQDGRGAAEDIHGGPHVTEDLAECPVLKHLQRGREGQNCGAQQQIRQS